jgi:hypothetical protein
MKSIAEPIARFANAEDKVNGRFWQGRFKAQVLRNEKALLAAMTYVDLNPVRADIAKGISTSKTHQRQSAVQGSSEGSESSKQAIAAVNCRQEFQLPNITNGDYPELVGLNINGCPSRLTG